MTTDAYIYDWLRSPIGRYAGGLAGVRPDDLASQVVRPLVERLPFPLATYEDIVIGNTIQTGEGSRNIARFVGLLSGLPVEVAGQTVNRLCGSGLAALVTASQAIRAGEGSLFVCGGVESMSRAPFVLQKADKPYSRVAEIVDTTAGVAFPNPAFVSGFGNDPMPATADNIGRELGIGREESDAFALASQEKYERARSAGFHAAEIAAIAVRSGKTTVLVEQDEHPRPDTNLVSLTKLRPLSEGGVVTAGNASGINDGAAALVIGSRAMGEAYGAPPRARIVACAVGGVEPRLMGLGPVPAIGKALERARLRLADMDVIEINEAFATQVLGCLSRLGLSAGDGRVNPNGGAIALGHPLGCSGARLALTAAHQLDVTGGRYALVSLCIGIGQGIAVVLERT